MGPVGLRLIVGLGNPGYEGTRHNTGFMVVDQLAKNWGLHFKRDGSAVIAEEPSGRVLMKPMSYMNRSGQPVGEFVRYYKVPPEEILIILDDAALPLGTVRIRKKGSSGGHNGLSSILTALATNIVPRLRIGVGSTEQNLTHHVLGSFSRDEIPIVENAITRACQAVEVLSSTGIDTAMNQFNHK
jgi:PTH1 family peptidyl-tRNA hydrolase